MKRSWIDPTDTQVPIVRQCELVGLAHSTYYYRGHGESPFNLDLMRLIDEQYTRTPFYGAPKMTAHLRTAGYAVNHKRIARLMRLMGLAAIPAKPKLSRPAPDHRIYPYLLRGLVIDRPNQVWSADVTYIRLLHGFIYLVAILDWFSRYVLAWEVSVTLDASFCLTALDWALHHATPDIFNTDQGAQFTCHDFTRRVEAAGARVSMDGRGRALDNVFVERLWRSVKYEEVYLHDYTTVLDAVDDLKTYFWFYNTERPHQALAYRTPAVVHCGARQ